MGSAIDVLVIGGGQAGLVMANILAQRGLAFVVHERQPRIGNSWRERFDSLVLFSSREMSTLPGMPWGGAPDGFPNKDDIATYLERYAERLTARVITGNGIARVSRSGGRFVALTDAGVALEPKAVVVATGPFQQPAVPTFARDLSPSVQKLDVLTYRNPTTIHGEHVIVVGDGASGRQLALELARTRRVVLATGKRRHFVPQTIVGKDSMWWFYRAGLLTADKATWMGRRVRALDSIPGAHLRSSALRRSGVTLAPRAIGARGRELVFAGGARSSCTSVIWALGYRDDVRWLDIPEAVAHGRFVQDRGMTPVPGLFHVGREWQNTRSSALVFGVERDARTIADRIESLLARATGRSSARATVGSSSNPVIP
jgi:putative flavoprotein involved in K+ transport